MTKKWVNNLEIEVLHKLCVSVKNNRRKVMDVHRIFPSQNAILASDSFDYGDRCMDGRQPFLAHITNGHMCLNGVTEPQ